MKRNWKMLESKEIYSNPWLKVREDKVLKPDGKEGIYGVIEKPPGVAIIAMDNDKNIFLIEQNRYTIGKILIELPAGACDTEDILENAQRKLFEEIGVKAKKWEILGKWYIAAGHENIVMYVCLATELDKNKSKSEAQEGDEAIERIFKVGIKELKQMIKDNHIEDGIALAALNLFFTKYNY